MRGDDYKTGIGLTTGFIGSHTITVYTLYDSQQLSFLSSSEDYGSNSATTAATNSWRPLPLLTNWLPQPTNSAVDYSTALAH
jgi:hypothetical protein